MVTPGSSGGFLLAFTALFDSGDRVGIGAPGYPSYRQILKALGLVPVDLRDTAMKRGHSIRTQVVHMNASVLKLGADHFQIMVFRSMAGTLVHDLKRAMAAVASRG